MIDGLPQDPKENCETNHPAIARRDRVVGKIELIINEGVDDS
jgi:hypothetical protein